MIARIVVLCFLCIFATHGQGAIKFYFHGTNVVTGDIVALGNFVGAAGSLTNGSPALATNNSTAADGALLTKSGDRLKLEDRWGFAIEDALRPKYIILTDEFCFGSHSSGTFGELGWRTLASGGDAGTGWGTNRPGVRALKSGSSVSNYFGITFSSPDWGVGYAISVGMSNWLCHFEFRLPSLLTNAQVIFGITRAPVLPPTWSNPPPGIFLYITNNSGPFQFLAKPNSGDWASSEVFSSTIDVDTNWHTLSISQTNGSVNGIFWVQVDQEAPIAYTNATLFTATINQCSPYIAITTGEAASKEVWIDRFVYIGSVK